MRTARKIAKNTFALLFSSSLEKIAGFIFTLYLARTLLPSEFGLISFALCVMGYIFMTVDFGLSTLGTREIARKPDLAKYFIKNIIPLRTIIAIILFVCVTFFVWLTIPKTLGLIFFIYSFGAFLVAVSTEFYFKGINQMEWIALSKVLMCILYGSMIFAFVKSHSDILMIPVSYLVGLLGGVGLLLIIAINKQQKAFFSFRPRIFKVMIYHSMPLATSALMGLAVLNIDTVMLGLISTNKAVGIYSSAYKIVWALIGGGAAFFDSVFPVISKLYKSDNLKMIFILRNSLRLVYVVTIPILFGGIYTAKDMLHFLYGDAYLSGNIILKLLLLTVLLWGVNNIFTRGLIACRNQKAFFRILSFQCVSNIVLNIILIPLWGGAGAAAATVFTEVIGLFLYKKAFDRTVNIDLFYGLKGPVLAALAMLIILLGFNSMVHISVIFQIMIASFFYFIFLYTFNGLTNEDFIYLKDLVKIGKKQ